MFKIPVEHNGGNAVPVINNTVDCFFKRGEEIVMVKIPVEHNGGNAVPVINNTVDCFFKEVLRREIRGLKV